MPFPAQRVIAVDIDGTLIDRGAINVPLLEWCRARRKDGFFLILWSARGEKYAREFATHYGCLSDFNVIISKPGYIVDDRGWDWTRATHVYTPAELSVPRPSVIATPTLLTGGAVG